MVANAPINAAMFAVEHEAYKWLAQGPCSEWSQDARRLTAGAMSGMASVFFACPSEYLKIQMQIQSGTTRFSGPLHCAKSIVRGVVLLCCCCAAAVLLCPHVCVVSCADRCTTMCPVSRSPSPCCVRSGGPEWPHGLVPWVLVDRAA